MANIVASHLQGRGFDFCLGSVHGEFSSGTPQSKDLHIRLIGVSKLAVVFE